MTAWFTDVKLDKLGDPTKSDTLKFEGTMNMTDGFSGCLIQVFIFVWSKNNPSNKCEFVEVHETCLGGRKTSQKVNVKIPLIKDQNYREGLQLFGCESLHYSFRQAKEATIGGLKKEGWNPPKGMGSGQLIAEWGP